MNIPYGIVHEILPVNFHNELSTVANNKDFEFINNTLAEDDDLIRNPDYANISRGFKDDPLGLSLWANDTFASQETIMIVTMT